jgi:hypothetical protein
MRKTILCIAIVAVSISAAAQSPWEECNTIALGDSLLASGCAFASGAVDSAEAYLRTHASIISGEPGPVVFTESGRRFWRAYPDTVLVGDPSNWPEYLCPKRLPLCGEWHDRAGKMLVSRATDLHDDGDPETPVQVPPEWSSLVTAARVHAGEWVAPVAGPTPQEALSPGYAPRTPEGGPDYANVGRRLSWPTPLPSSFAGTFHNVAAVALSPDVYAKIADAAVDIALRWPAEKEAGLWVANPGPATSRLNDWTATSPSPPPSVPELWSFDKLASGRGSEPPVVEKMLDGRTADRLNLAGIYSFRRMEFQGKYSYALFYLTGPPGREWEKAVAYCHIRNGRRQRQVLACVAGEGEWRGKPKASARINPPIIPGQDLYLSASYGPKAFSVSVSTPTGNQLAEELTLVTVAEVEIRSTVGLPSLVAHRLQLGHPADAEPPDFPSDVAIRSFSATGM